METVMESVMAQVPVTTALSVTTLHPSQSSQTLYVHNPMLAKGCSQNVPPSNGKHRENCEVVMDRDEPLWLRGVSSITTPKSTLTDSRGGVVMARETEPQQGPQRRRDG